MTTMHPEPITSRIVEVSAVVGTVYRTDRGWWGNPHALRYPVQLFEKRADALAYVRDAAAGVAL